MVSGLEISGSEARDMLSGDTVVGGVGLSETGFDEASVGAPEKLDSDESIPSSAAMVSSAIAPQREVDS